MAARFHHTFTIDALGVDEEIHRGLGNSVTVMVTMPQEGALTFYCRYHASAEFHRGEFEVTSVT